MKTLVKAFSVCAVVCGISVSTGFVAGKILQEQVIQATCEDEQAHTMLQGKEYICMTMEKVERDSQAIFQEGIKAGRRLAQRDT